jgi:hypothetical protein
MSSNNPVDGDGGVGATGGLSACTPFGTGEASGTPAGVVAAGEPGLRGVGGVANTGAGATGGFSARAPLGTGGANGAPASCPADGGTHTPGGGGAEGMLPTMPPGAASNRPQSG